MTCAICARAITSPKTRTVDGRIVEQCVAKCHDAAVLARDDDRTRFLLSAIVSFAKANQRRLD